MRKTRTAVAVLAMIAGAAQADVYTDNTGSSDVGGDINSFFFDQGFDHLDITQVEVTNDASFIYFDISVAGDLDATNWGKYLIGMDTGRVGTTNTGAWGRNIDWGQGMTDFVGSWADDGGSAAGAELHAWDGAAWNLTDATYLAGTEIQGDDSNHAAGTQRIAVSLSALGLGVGDVLLFDVASTGGGFDPGVDHLSRSDFATDDWANQSMSGDYLSYTITVPAPASAALLGLGGLAAMRRRR
ncbi:MAG: PEP-CTERM sorting domain-containing protein [Phycisphaerales bacterium]|nr:PEP-CTERM sorting domain-containing protein [Phycisphaerales bacterium]